MSRRSRTARPKKKTRFIIIALIAIIIAETGYILYVLGPAIFRPRVPTPTMLLPPQAIVLEALRTAYANGILSSEEVEKYSNITENSIMYLTFDQAYYSPAECKVLRMLNNVSSNFDVYIIVMNPVSIYSLSKSDLDDYRRSVRALCNVNLDKPILLSMYWRLPRELTRTRLVDLLTLFSIIENETGINFTNIAVNQSKTILITFLSENILNITESGVNWLLIKARDNIRIDMNNTEALLVKIKEVPKIISTSRPSNIEILRKINNYTLLNITLPFMRVEDDYAFVLKVNVDNIDFIISDKYITPWCVVVSDELDKKLNFIIKLLST